MIFWGFHNKYKYSQTHLSYDLHIIELLILQLLLKLLQGLYTPYFQLNRVLPVFELHLTVHL